MNGKSKSKKKHYSRNEKKEIAAPTTDGTNVYVPVLCAQHIHTEKNNTKIVMFMAGLCIEMAVILQYGALADPILERPY